MDYSNGTHQPHVIDIQLPAQYGTAPSVETIQAYLSDVSSILDSPKARALVDQHPNAVAADTSGASPAGIEHIWDWAGQVGLGLEGAELDDKREASLAGLCRSELDDQVSEARRRRSR